MAVCITSLHSYTGGWDTWYNLLIRRDHFDVQDLAKGQWGATTPAEQQQQPQQLRQQVRWTLFFPIWFPHSSSLHIPSDWFHISVSASQHPSCFLRPRAFSREIIRVWVLFKYLQSPSSQFHLSERFTDRKQPVALRRTWEECRCNFRSSWACGEVSHPEWGMITALVSTARASWMMGIFRASQEDRFHRTPEEDSTQSQGRERGKSAYWDHEEVHPRHNWCRDAETAHRMSAGHCTDHTAFAHTLTPNLALSSQPRTDSTQKPAEKDSSVEQNFQNMNLLAPALYHYRLNTVWQLIWDSPDLEEIIPT